MLSKSQARGFFLGGTALSFAVFLGLSWNTLSVTVPKQTKAENITPEVIAGKASLGKQQLYGLPHHYGRRSLLRTRAYQSRRKKRRRIHQGSFDVKDPLVT
jgi:hypothetical protein